MSFHTPTARLPPTTPSPLGPPRGCVAALTRDLAVRSSRSSGRCGSTSMPMSRTDLYSKKIGELLLKGWTLLGETCPATGEARRSLSHPTFRKGCRMREKLKRCNLSVSYRGHFALRLHFNLTCARTRTHAT